MRIFKQEVSDLFHAWGCHNIPRNDPELLLCHLKDGTPTMDDHLIKIHPYPDLRAEQETNFRRICVVTEELNRDVRGVMGCTSLSPTVPRI